MLASVGLDLKGTELGGGGNPRAWMRQSLKRFECQQLVDTPKPQYQTEKRGQAPGATFRVQLSWD